MSVATITYSPSGQGWTSRWSYEPDLMIGMNNVFYTWKNGFLYKHDSNSKRNAFYINLANLPDEDYYTYPSTVTTIFNQEPTSVKMFKTLTIDSNEPWDVDVTTDLGTGEIQTTWVDGAVDSTWFVEKEGNWSAHIRRTSGDGDNRSISTQGIGNVLSYDTLVITFGFNIGSSVSQGDSIYNAQSGSLVLVGEVASHDSTSITLVSASSTPNPGDFLVYVKNSAAESYGSRGYYMEALLTNRSESEVELFEVSTNIFKSFM